jgi:hypothetical protein
MKNDKKNKAETNGAIPGSRRTMEMLFSGLEIYSAMTQRLLGITRPSSQQNSEKEIRISQEALVKSFQDLFELLSPYMKKAGCTESAVVSFEAWQEFIKSFPLTSLPMPQLYRELKVLADNWQTGTHKLFNDWNECQQELAASYQAALSRGEDPKQLWISSTASYEKFYNALIEARFSFVMEHMKALFKMLQSFLPEESPIATVVQEKTDKEESTKGRKTVKKKTASAKVAKES